PLMLAVILTIAGVLIITMRPKAPEKQDIASASANPAAVPHTTRNESEDVVQRSANKDYSGSRPAAFSPVSSPVPEQRLARLTPAVVAAPLAPAAPSAAREGIELPAPAADETGTLAVNSLLPAEIYMGGKYLGSTPTTLDLPAGTHTLEYRHKDLRKVVTHVIRAGEITAQRITF